MKRSSVLRVAVGVALVATMMPILGGTAFANKTGNEGCTPGFWRNHPEDWQEYNPDTKTVGRMFSQVPLPDDVQDAYGDTLAIDALEFEGGSGYLGAARILLRHAVAAYLNAASEDVAYPYRRHFGTGGEDSLDDQLAEAFAGGRAAMLALKDKLDAANNLGGAEICD
jgi:hypothetical protein